MGGWNSRSPSDPRSEGGLAEPSKIQDAMKGCVPTDVWRLPAANSKQANYAPFPALRVVAIVAEPSVESAAVVQRQTTRYGRPRQSSTRIAFSHVPDLAFRPTLNLSGAGGQQN